MVLDTVPNLFWHPSLAGGRLPGPAEIAIGDDRDDAAMTLPPPKAVEQWPTGLLGSLADGKNQPYSIGLIDSTSSAAGNIQEACLTELRERIQATSVALSGNGQGADDSMSPTGAQRASNSLQTCPIRTTRVPADQSPS